MTDERRTHQGMTTSRQPKGVPVGGQFATATHGEPSIILTAQGVPASPAIHEVTRMHRKYREQMAAVVKRMDTNCLHSTLITAKDMYPGAKELRLKHHTGAGPYSEKYEPASIRIADGTLIPAETTDPEHEKWWHKAPPLADPGSIYDAVTQISSGSEIWQDRRCEWDPAREEMVIYLDGRTSSAHQNG
jgi:hypothetical protein